MTTNTIEHYRLFEAGPSLKSLAFASPETRRTLHGLTRTIASRIGAGQRIYIYPHRILQQKAWNLNLIGETGNLHLLLNIAGRFELPVYDERWPVRPVINVSDHVDAYWLVEYLSVTLNLTPSRHSRHLSTIFGDNIVQNKGNEHE